MKNDKINVLQIVGAPAGGIRKHIIDIIVELPSEQYEIGLAASLKDADQVFLAQLPTLDQRCKKRIYDIKIDKKPSWKDVQNMYRLFRHIRDEKYDIIHGHGAKGGLYARILGTLLRTKVIYTPHGGSLHSMHGKIKNKLYTWIERGLYIFTDQLIFESEYSRQTYFNKVYRAEKKSVVNYNGVASIEAYEKRLPLNKERVTKICAFGILRYVKGHDILVHAAKMLIDAGYKVQVNIYGLGEERENLESLIYRLELHHDVFLRGETDQVIEHMKESDILVHPSRFESFGYVVVEAMSVGLPVIASSVGGIVEVVKNNINGLLISDNEPHHYAEAIKYLLEVEGKASEFSLQAYHDSHTQFSLSKMIAGLSKIYDAK